MILDVYKGETKEGEIVEYFEDGGQIGDRLVLTNVKINLNLGDEVVLFLAKLPDCAYGCVYSKWLLHPPQSVYYYVPPLNNELTALSSNVMRNVCADNNLILTSADLLRIAEQFLSK
jgi:hypothetical protein